MAYEKITIPQAGNKITFENGLHNVPDRPIIAVIEGDGVGPGIWETTKKVIDAVVQKSYGGEKEIEWLELFAGEKSKALYQSESYLPDETIAAIKEYKILIKGPLSSALLINQEPIHSFLNHKLDLYISLQPLQYIKGMPSPLKTPETINLTLLKENLESINANIEIKRKSEDAKKLLSLLKESNHYSKIRFPETSSFRILTLSSETIERMIKSALKFAIAQDKKSITIIHKGKKYKDKDSIFCQSGYEIAKSLLAEKVISWEECGGNAPEDKILIQDCDIHDFLKQMQTCPQRHSLIVTTGLNGEFISEIMATQIGPQGTLPISNFNNETGIAIFETSHGILRKFSGLNKANPTSLILAGQMALEKIGWRKAASILQNAVSTTIESKKVTYDVARFLDGATILSCSDFGDYVIENFQNE